MLSLLFLLAAAAAPDARLVCSVDEQLVVVAPETGTRKPLERQPPQAAVALGAAGDTLVGVSASGAVLQLRDGQWREVTRLGGNGVQKWPLRIDSRYSQWATIWLRGDDPGTVPGAIGVSAKGEMRRYNSEDADKMGVPFRAAPRTLGEADRAIPKALAKPMDGGPPPELLFNEPSPCGGRRMPLGSWHEHPAAAPLRRRRRLHRHAPRGEPARGVHRRARPLHRADAAPGARDELRRIHVRPAAGARRGRAHPHLHSGPRASVRGASGARVRVRRRRAAPRRRGAAGDRPGHRASRATPRRRPGGVRAHAAADPDLAVVRARGGVARCSRGAALTPTGARLQERAAARLRGAGERGGGCGAAPR